MAIINKNIIRNSHHLKKIRRRLGMRPRLLLIFILVALIPMTVQFAADYWQARRYMQEQAHLTLEQIARVQQRRMNQELKRMLHQFELIASRTQMRISVRSYIHGGEQPELALINRILHDVLASSERYREIRIFSPTGDSVAAVVGTGEGELPDRFPRLSSASPVLSLAWLDNDVPALWISGSLMLQGEVIGSLHILTYLNDIFDVMQDFSCREVGGRTYLLLPDHDAQLKIVESRCAKHGDSMRMTLLDLEEMGVDLEMLLHDASEKPLHVGDHLLLIRPLVDSLGYVWVDTSLSLLQSRLMNQARFMLFLLLLSILLCVVLADRFTRVLTLPLQHLLEATRQMRRGNLGVRIKEHYWGEFIELRRSFNQMASRLSRQTSNLKHEISIRRQSQQVLTDLANTDSLTGLVNRRHFMDILSAFVSRSQPQSSPGALLFVDLDNFKPINDDFGHEAGDAVLQIVAERLRHLLREGDIAGRMGGDEFALLLPTNSGKELEPHRMAQRVEDQLSQPMSFKGYDLRVGCSVGVTEIMSGDSPQAVISRADADMYRVKSSRKT